jgi:PKD repeat protein
MAVALLLASAVVVLTPAASLALPVADFTFAPEAPQVDEPATFTFTGSCDEPPCRIQWRWFRNGGSSLGTTMGEGPEISYTFAQPGSYQVVVKITNSLPTHGSDSATRTVVVEAAPEPPPVPPVVVQDRDRALVLDGWRGQASTTASKGGYRVGHGRATLHFAGRRVVYAAVTGPDLGLADVRVDHAPARRVDLYSPVPARRSWSFRVGPGRHVLTVRSTGEHSASSTGTAITLDELVVGPAGDVVHVDDRSLRVSYGRWSGRRIRTASGGTARVATRPGATVRLSFTGTSVTWVTASGRDQGRARVRIDGVAVATVDNHTASSNARVERTFPGLVPGDHRVTIVVLRDRRASVVGQVTVDAFASE